jgi:hypothetical protein
MGFPGRGIRKMCSRFLGILTALLLSAFGLPADSKAGSFDWLGTCTLGCDGTASGLLTLTDGSAADTPSARSH